MNQQDREKMQLLNDLNNLLEKINSQKYIYNLNYNEEANCLNYRIIYSLDNIKDYKIHLSNQNINNPNILNLLKKILLRFSLLKNKTRENINNKLIDEYIKKLETSNYPINLIDEIDKELLLKKLKERKEDIIAYQDPEIATRVIISTLENLIALNIFSLVNKTVAGYILVYTLVTPFIYTYIPHKIDKFKNRKKYNETIANLIKEESTKQPVLKLFCIINKKIYELSNEDEAYFQEEINKLRKILEDYYNSGSTNENKIDLNIINQIEEIYSEIESKKTARKPHLRTINFTNKNEKTYLKKIQ